MVRNDNAGPYCRAATVNETPEEREQRYRTLFEKLGPNLNGQVDLQTFRDSLTKNNHLLKDSDEAMLELFETMDCNGDQMVDYNDFRTFALDAEAHIAAGFCKLDTDGDGKVTLKEVFSYLEELERENDLSRKFTRNVSLREEEKEISMFLNWSFHHDARNTDPHSLTFEQWRDFLLFIPRKRGSRLHTAFSYFYDDNIDVSIEGDATLINEFIRGFGYFITGGISGVISRTCTAPLDRIKVFLIARSDLSSTLLNTTQEVLARNPNAKIEKIQSPIVKAIRTLYHEGGLKAFYVGNGLNAFKVFPESSIKFGSFELTKKLMCKLEGVENKDELSRFSTYIAGGLAGMAAQFSSYPIDTLKFRIQCAPLNPFLRGKHLLLDTAKQMYQEGGIKIFYRGISVGLLGVFPYAALDLGTFTAIKKFMVARKAASLQVPVESVTLDNISVLSIGAFSGTVGATVVYPLNLLRTRLQAQGTYAHPHRYKGFTDVFLKTVKREGFPGLYKGLVPTLAKVCPAVAISYLCYENLKKLVGLT